jgi:hypothetical protein
MVLKVGSVASSQVYVALKSGGGASSVTEPGTADLGGLSPIVRVDVTVIIEVSVSASPVTVEALAPKQEQALP